MGEQTATRTPGAVPPPYLTAAEAAAHLRTTVQGVYALVKRGRLHPMPGRPGRLLFTRETLDRSLTTRRR
ncbi:MAG: helix-turn-helix domain-containing protein [Gemmataceae bacterium]|nr:helix-turn-helix domain-containing protein [Gemmataceae bacterium]